MESKRLRLLSTQTQREGNLGYENVSRELAGGTTGGISWGAGFGD